MAHHVAVRVLSRDALTDNIPGLVEILLECVRDGASIGFLSELTHDQALEYWQKVSLRFSHSELLVLAAFVDGELAGTVQLIFSPQPNQPHRADIAKLLVSPRYRRLGIASALMQKIEEVASSEGRDLLVLDTLTGTGAELLYLGLGWTKIGEIPRYALLPEGGEPHPTSIFYKSLKK
jgi:ribosomal protein S18 acetylase RimI-like enzyme